MTDIQGTVPPILVIFDGTCGFCTRCARLATERAPAGRLLAAPNQTPGLIDRYGLTREDVDRFVWVIGSGGRRWRGAAAVSRILRSMGGAWWLLGCLAALPGANLGYRALAGLRSRLSGLWGDAPPCG
jgi:predicted DCC family thiol-disulfide oxidoreductase YuxK